MVLSCDRGCGKCGAQPEPLPHLSCTQSSMTHVTSGLSRESQLMFAHLLLPNLSKIPSKQAQAHGKLSGSGPNVSQ